MRTAAEVDEVGPERILGEDIVRFLGDQLDLHLLVSVLAQALFLRRHHAVIGQVPRLDLRHLLLNLFQVFGRERSIALEIVEEACICRRADSQLCFRIQFEDGGGQQVRSRMPVHLEGGRIFGR